MKADELDELLAISPKKASSLQHDPNDERASGNFLPATFVAGFHYEDAVRKMPYREMPHFG